MTRRSNASCNAAVASPSSSRSTIRTAPPAAYSAASNDRSPTTVSTSRTVPPGRHARSIDATYGSGCTAHNTDRSTAGARTRSNLSQPCAASSRSITVIRPGVLRMQDAQRAVTVRTGVVVERRRVFKKHVGHHKPPRRSPHAETGAGTLARPSPRLRRRPTRSGRPPVRPRGHVIRRPSEVGKDMTIARRTSIHTRGGHPLRKPQLIAARTPAVSMARVPRCCDVGHDLPPLDTSSCRGPEATASRLTGTLTHPKRTSQRHGLLPTTISTGPAIRHRI